jgi:hypothetical protein
MRSLAKKHSRPHEERRSPFSKYQELSEWDRRVHHADPGAAAQREMILVHEFQRLAFDPFPPSCAQIARTGTSRKLSRQRILAMESL